MDTLNGRTGEHGAGSGGHAAYHAGRRASAARSRRRGCCWRAGRGRRFHGYAAPWRRWRSGQQCARAWGSSARQRAVGGCCRQGCCRRLPRQGALSNARPAPAAVGRGQRAGACAARAARVRRASDVWCGWRGLPWQGEGSAPSGRGAVGAARGGAQSGGGVGAAAPGSGAALAAGNVGGGRVAGGQGTTLCLFCDTHHHHSKICHGKKKAAQDALLADAIGAEERPVVPGPDGDDDTEVVELRNVPCQMLRALNIVDAAHEGVRVLLATPPFDRRSAAAALQKETTDAGTLSANAEQMAALMADAVGLLQDSDLLAAVSTHRIKVKLGRDVAAVLRGGGRVEEGAKIDLKAVCTRLATVTSPLQCFWWQNESALARVARLDDCAY